MDAKEIIKKHLDGMAEKDEAFRAAYENPKKNLEDCFTYILNQARSHGNAVCMSDEEVFGMAVHYYVESDIKVGKRPRVDVVAEQNRKALELTDEEKDKLKKQAEEIFLNAQVEELRKKAEAEAKKQREAAIAREKKQKEKEAERLAKKREEKERATAGMGMLFEF